MEVSYFVVSILGTFLIAGVCTVVHLLRFVLSLRTPKKDAKPERNNYLPKCAIILCLRGADPFLPSCIQSLVAQDYPNFEVIVVIDNPADSATPIVEAALKQYGSSKIRVSFLENVRPNCGLKCSAMIQAVSSLDASYEIAAFVDADITAPTTWLRELVDPLQDPQIAVATGNRWYLPIGERCGTLVRYLWNVHVSQRMATYGVVWGGSFAIKTAVLRQIGLLNYWSQCLSDDVIIGEIVKAHGYRVQFVPKAIMLNCEETELFALVKWIRRQQLFGYLYHKSWFYQLMIEGFFFPIPIITSLVYAIYCAAQAQWISAALSIAFFLVVMFSISVTALYLELCIQQVIHKQYEISCFGFVKFFLNVMVWALPTIVITLSAAFVASFIKTVNWRGVSYLIKGPWDVQLIEYKPYELDQSEEVQKLKLSI